MAGFDEMMMKPEDLAKIQALKASWSATSNADERLSYNAAAESIRSQYGYSGGTSGDKFIMTSTPMPSIPSMPSYDSEYGDAIDQALSNFIDRPDFSWNAETDEGYQQFMRQVNKNAESTFNDTIAGVSVGTGGRPNSWAATIASKAMGDILGQGAAEMSTFRDAAFNMYQQEGQLDLQQLQALMGLDEVAYGRFVDGYNSEVTKYNMEIQSRQQSLSEAMSRTEMTGYVSNADSIIIGVPAGTLSQEAMNRALDKQEYLEKAALKGLGDGDDGGGVNNMSLKEIKANLKDMFIEDKTMGTPDEKGAYLVELYNSKRIDYETLKLYAQDLGATFPNGMPSPPNEDGTTGTRYVSKDKYNQLTKWRELYPDDDEFIKVISEAIEVGTITMDDYQGWLDEKVRTL